MKLSAFAVIRSKNGNKAKAATRSNRETSGDDMLATGTSCLPAADDVNRREGATAGIKSSATTVQNGDSAAVATVQSSSGVKAALPHKKPKSSGLKGVRPRITAKSTSSPSKLLSGTANADPVSCGSDGISAADAGKVATSKDSVKSGAKAVEGTVVLEYYQYHVAEAIDQFVFYFVFRSVDQTNLLTSQKLYNKTSENLAIFWNVN